ncbi:MAG: hypothetical protein LIO74_02840 [Ruminococcus sp.]|nr:hypothetical protein [Ruminococcus sp.]
MTVSGCTYYLNTNGVMQIGWLTLDGNTYYFNASGVMQTGMKTIDSAQYYFNASGVMQTGWITISGTSYYFDTTTGELTNTGHAAVQLDVPDYKQFDSQWANTTIIYSTIGKVGCLATSIAMKYS